MRMRPLTRHMNKHLIPVHMRPMIEYALSTLLGLGIREILVVTGRGHLGSVVEVLGSGRDYGRSVELTYKVQDDAMGIAHALGLAERFAGGRRVVAILADNLHDDESIAPVVHAWSRAEPAHAMNFLTRVEDPREYGVATVADDRVVEIVEKPEVPASDLAVTGLYLYPPDVFDKIRELEVSERGEFEVTDLNNAYIREDRLRFHVVERWFDAGEPGPWMATQRYVESHPERFPEKRFRLRED